jgi:hypothetical protein
MNEYILCGVQLFYHMNTRPLKFKLVLVMLAVIEFKKNFIFFPSFF